MRTAVYARVSTEDQEREGTSLETQTEACLRNARESGAEVPRERVIHEVASGLTLDRLKLTELRHWAKRKEVDAVFIYSTDRLSRDPVHLLLLVDEFDKAGVKIHFVTEPLDNSLEGQLLGFVRGWASKVEALKIRERTMRGKLSKAKEGRQPCGRAAYGYRLIEGKHDIEPEEAEVVRMIFGWLANEGMTLRAIQLRLNRLGVPTREGKSWWQRATLYRIVRDPIFKGQWFYNKRMKAPARNEEGGSVQVLKPVEHWIPVTVPAIVSEAIYEAAQRQLARNKELSQRNTRRDYLLTGLLRCGKCGFKLNARTVKGKTYYGCNSKLGTISPEGCSSGYIRGSKLEPLIWSTVSQLLAQPQLIAEQIEKQSGLNRAADVEAGLKRVEQAVQRKAWERDRLLEAYKAGAIELDVLKREMDKIRAEEAKLLTTRSELTKQLRVDEGQEANMKKVHEFCKRLPATLQSLSFGEKREILRQVIDRIVIDGQDVVIYGIIPMPQGENEMSIGVQSS